MKKTLAFLAGLALASAAFAEVNPARPMLTGHGNVSVAPAQVIITNQTAAETDPVKLDRFVVTGSLLVVNPTRPMLTGHGNVSVAPAQVIITNQTAAETDPVKLDRFVVTGSLLKP